MAWRIIRQPNGGYARFSEIVDHFTCYDMNEEEAREECKREPGMGQLESEAKVRRANENPQRFEEAVKIIKRVHGAAEAKKYRKLLST